MIHCGTHGTLEWLPGKSVALSRGCAPEVVLGATPVIYPFIVNNPGEAAQAKRRIAAVTIGHMTPPLIDAGAMARRPSSKPCSTNMRGRNRSTPARARLLADAILDRAAETGLPQDCGLEEDADPLTALARLDAWLCDLKDMRIGDGLHIFGRGPQGALRRGKSRLP